MIRRLIILLLIVGCVFGEDNYPYFSDINKQMEFEKQKIYINKVDEQEQYIVGGGSEFNWLSLLNPYLDSYAQQPMYLQSDIETNYKYIYTFEIIRNNKIITEVDLLYIVGLNKEAEEIIANYNKKLNRYNFWQKINIDNQNIINKKNEVNASSIALTMATYFVLKIFAYESEIKGIQVIAFPVGIIVHLIRINSIDELQEIPESYKIRPMMEQKLALQQLESIAESYNRNSYKILTPN